GGLGAIPQGRTGDRSGQRADQASQSRADRRSHRLRHQGHERARHRALRRCAEGRGRRDERSALEGLLRVDGRRRRAAQGPRCVAGLYAGIRQQGHRQALGGSGMYQVSEEHSMLRDLVKKFVRNELMPLEKNILDRFAAGQPAALSDEENVKLFKQCRDLGLWALDVPEEAGGANLPAVALVGVNEELGYTAVPFTFPPDSPNLHMLLATASPEQRKKYLEPYAQGLTTSAIAI